MKKRYAHYRVERTYDGSWTWVLVVGSRVLVHSNTVFATKGRAISHIKLVKKYAGKAEITEEAE